MPENPRISVHDYIDARLDEQDIRVDKRLEEQDDKIEILHIRRTIEIKELKGWFFMLSGPGWAQWIRDYLGNDRNGIASAIALVMILIGLMIIFFYRTRKPLLRPKPNEG